jgi:hypothetical protein
MISWKHAIAMAASGAAIAIMLVGQATDPPAPTKRHGTKANARICSVPASGLL